MNISPAITDSHCHLDFPDFADELDSIISRAQAAGVHRMVTICTKLQNEPSVRAIAEQYAPVFYAAGIHPMSAADEPLVKLDELLAFCEHKKMVGIGETGLDYYYSSDSAEIQKASLLVHICAAQQSGLPLIIHARAADEDIADILSAEYKNAPYPCVMHCFSSGETLARRCLDLGFYLSLSGITAFPKSDQLRAIFKLAPQERLLVETDSPYLAPPPHRGRRNEPAYVALTARAAADFFGQDYAAFAVQVEKNFNQLFAKAAAYEATQ